MSDRPPLPPNLTPSPAGMPAPGGIPAPPPNGMPVPQQPPVPNGTATVESPVAKPQHSGDSLKEIPQSSLEGIHLDQLLELMVAEGASDLHIPSKPNTPVRIRVSGRLVPMVYNGHRLMVTGEDVRRLLTDILNEDRLQHFDHNHELDFAYGPQSVDARFRCNYFMGEHHMGAVFRQIPTEIKTIDNLALPESIRRLCQFPRGLVLVTGPTGSGKSTTLAAMIDEINRHREEHILTIEDPIEFVHRSKKSLINQREVGPDTDSFANALRAALREDPDVILVGEMRDPETISLGITAAETGHLVFATLHTQDASQTVDRLIDSFPPDQQSQIRTQLSMTLQGVISQQLLRTADGQGRVVACEILLSTDALRNHLREGETEQIYSLMQTGGQFGMQTMEAALADLTTQGVITRQHAIDRSSRPGEFNHMMADAMGAS